MERQSQHQMGAQVVHRPDRCSATASRPSLASWSCTCTLLPALEHLPGGTYATANRPAALPVDGLVGTTSFSRAPRRGPRTAHRRASGRSASPRPSYFGWFTLEGNGRNEKKIFGGPRENNHARRTSCPRRARGERGPRNAAAERFTSRERSRGRTSRLISVDLHYNV